jgi:Holliday junction resolvase
MGFGLKRNRTQWRDNLARTSWQDFERLLAQHYREVGYAVTHTGTAEAASRFDGGVDLMLKRDGETVLVQCKHWNAAQVPHNDVHQLLGLLETTGADRAILITSGEFTTAAMEAGSRSRRIELVDGVALRTMVDPRLIPEPAQVAGRGHDGRASDWLPVAEKAIDAVMAVHGGRRWRRERQSPEAALKEQLLKLAVAGVLVLLGFLFIRSQINNLGASFARPPAETRTTVQPMRAPAGQSTPRPVAQAAQQKPSTGTAPMTPEQLAEWEKKNAEAMKIIEQRVPSVYD